MPSKFFEVTTDQLGRLTPEHFTDLLRRLLLLEAHNLGLSRNNVEVSLNLPVSDGGMDGRISWSGDPQPSESGWLPSRNNLFQIKATEMFPADCADEVTTNGGNSLKSQIRNLVEDGGAYILFLQQDNLNTSLRQRRESTIRESIEQVTDETHDDLTIGVYDLEKIREWTNQYGGTIAFVNKNAGPGAYFRAKDWYTWENDCDPQHDYIDTQELKGFREQLRSHLREAGNVARIIGLSGLGKTRLALETFRVDDDSTDNFNQEHALRDLVIFWEYHRGETQVFDLVASLIQSRIRAILVIDELPEEEHRQLLNKVQNSRNEFVSLLTIDYQSDPPTNRPNYEYFELRPQPEDVIEGIVRSIQNTLSEPEVNRIVQLSQGFPEVAKLIADNYQSVDRLGELRDDLLFKRIVWGRDNPTETSKKILKACSLFDHFGVEGDMEHQAEYIAEKLANVDYQDFHRELTNFQNRNVAYRRGDLARIVPLPLAFYYAAEWLDETPDRLLQTHLIEQLPDDLLEPLAIRLEKLDFSEDAREIADELLERHGPLGTRESVSSKTGSRLVSALAEIHPQAASDNLSRNFGFTDTSDLFEVTGKTRRNLVRALSKLAWRPATFDDAAKLLLKFGAAETERWDNNASGLFKRLFRPRLSGTRVPAHQRLDVIRDAIDDSHEQELPLVIGALGEAFTWGHETRLMGVESQGTRPLEEDWSPDEWPQLLSYWEECAELLVQFAIRENDLGELAQSEFESAFKTLMKIQHPDAVDIIQGVAARVTNCTGIWPEAAQEIRTSQKYLDTDPPDEIQTQIQSILQKLEGQNLEDLFESIVKRGDRSGGYQEHDGRHMSSNDIRARRVAEEFFSRPEELRQMIPLLVCKPLNCGYEFGRKIGEQPDIAQDLIAPAIEEYGHTQSERRTPLFIRGLVRELHDHDPDEVNQHIVDLLQTSDLAELGADLANHVGPTPQILDEIINSLEAGRISWKNLRSLSPSRWDEISVDDLETFFRSCSDHSAESAGVVISLITNYLGHSDQLDDDLVNLFKNLIIEKAPFKNPQVAEGIDNLFLRSVAERILNDYGDPEFVTQIVEQIATTLLSPERTKKETHHAAEFLDVLIEEYPKTTWDTLGERLKARSQASDWSLQTALPGTGFNSKLNTLISNIPNDYLMQWLEDNPQMAPRIARLVPVIVNENSGSLEVSYGQSSDPEDASPPDLQWTDFGKRILKKFGDKEGVRTEISANIHSFGWMGSLVPLYDALRECFEEIIDHDLESVRQWAHEEIDFIDDRIAREKKQEEEENIRNAPWYED